MEVLDVIPVIFFIYVGVGIEERLLYEFWFYFELKFEDYEVVYLTPRVFVFDPELFLTLVDDVPVAVPL